jgi:MFS family permease
MFVLQGAFNFLPTFLQRTKDFSPTLASASYGLLFVMGMVVMPISGTLSDRGERTTIAIGTLTVSAVGLAGVVAAGTTWLIVASVALFAAGLLGFPPVIQAYLMDHFPDESMGRDFGGFKTVYIAVGSLSPIYVGFVASQVGYDPAFWSLVGCLFLSAALIAAVRTLID